MPRKTISIPKATLERIERARRKGESFSAAIARLAEAGFDATDSGRRPAFIGVGDAPPLGKDVEDVLDEILAEMDPHD